jgi:GPR1/FUN34/yaaH family
MPSALVRICPCMLFMLQICACSAPGTCVNSSHMTTGLLCTGGIAQLLAGMWEARRGKIFGATAFSSYGAFWISFGLFGVLSTVSVLLLRHGVALHGACHACTATCTHSLGPTSLQVWRLVQQENSLSVLSMCVPHCSLE